MSISVLNRPGQLVEVKLWTPLEGVDPGALDQLSNVARLPWVFHHVAVMPDVHAGKGCTVGSVIAMKDALAPAAVGVDIGCGMGAIRTSLKASDLPDNLDGLRAAIETAIPVGFNSHEETGTRDWMDLQLLFNYANHLLAFESLQAEKVREDLTTRQRVVEQVGTLGGGNHFIEVCLDENQDVWLMLHSGSRYVGLAIAQYHIEKAQKLIHNAGIPDPDMAVFLAGTPEMKAYRHDLMWAQKYAMFNRRVMFEHLKDAFEDSITGSPAWSAGPVQFDAPILCHHNFVSEETHFGEQVYVTRKGAIEAGLGDLAIIPGSMGAKSFIVRGLGNPESFNSASHGAGRKMSRSKAKKTFTVEDLAAQTAGVNCRKDADIVDEIPGAYKSIDEVMANQSDLVEIVHTLKQVLCVKG